MDSIIAINIIDNANIINKGGIPLLYYWDGKTKPIDVILSNDVFMDYIKNNITSDNYTSLQLKYCYFTIIDEIEQYNNCSENIQNIITADNLPDVVINNIICKPFNTLYKHAFDKDFEFTDYSFTDINNICKEISDKYKDKITVVTISNYIRKELLKTYNLSNDNVNLIIDNIINNVII